MGKQIEYLTCPFCSRNMTLNKIRPAEMATLKQDPANEWFIFQVREARGRSDGIKGAGFYLVPEKSKTIIEMLQEPRLRPYAEGVLSRLKVIIRSYQEAGLL